jgi:hypothetical protein
MRRPQPGKVYPVAPAGDGVALHRDFPAAYEEPIALGRRLDHGLALAVERDSNRLGEYGHVLGARAAYQNGIARLGNGDLVLDFLSGVAIDCVGGWHGGVSGLR